MKEGQLTENQVGDFKKEKRKEKAEKTKRFYHSYWVPLAFLFFGVLILAVIITAYYYYKEKEICSLYINGVDIHSNDTIKSIQKRGLPIVFENVEKHDLYTGDYWYYDFEIYDRIEGFDDMSSFISGYFTIENNKKSIKEDNNEHSKQEC